MTRITIERDELASRVRELEGENDRLIKALAECRNAFPIPEPGAQAENEWMQAMGCPESVPEFVRAALAAQPGSAGEVEAIDTDEDGQESAWVSLHQKVSLGQKLYAAPTAPLSDAEILALWSGSDTALRPVLGGRKVIAFARAIERAVLGRGGEQ